MHATLVIVTPMAGRVTIVKGNDDEVQSLLQWMVELTRKHRKSNGYEVYRLRGYSVDQNPNQK